MMNASIRIAGQEEKLKEPPDIRPEWLDIRPSHGMIVCTLLDKMRRKGCGYEDDV